MQNWQRQVGIFTLLALFITPSFVFAQGDNSVSGVGSGVVAPLIEALKEASGSEVLLNVNVTGTSSGFDQFCQGQADITGANRSISIDEDANCVSNGIEYAELLVGHEIVAFITNPDVTFAQCFSSSNLKAIFQPSSEGNITSWNQAVSDYPELSLSIFSPATENSGFLILDRLVEGDGIRADAITKSSDADIIASVSETSGAVGLVSLAAAVSAGDTIQIMQLDTTEVPGCQDASAENVESRLYNAANELYIYVNRASLDKAGLRELVNFAISAEAASTIEGLGFSAPTTAALETNLNILQGTEEGTQPSRRVADFQIPPTIAGQINMGGAASAFDYLQNLTTSFTATYPNVATDLQFRGEPAGFRRLCNGEIDIAVTYSGLSDEQASNCEANNIDTITIDLGRQATILVANGNTEFLGCLTTEQLATLWNANSRGEITTWSQIDESFGDLSVALFAPSVSNFYSDLMFLAADSTAIPARDDTEIDADPLYRAAATANVEGGLTYMSWPEYQQVVANNQSNIQLVSVDGGAGCVAPSESTIADGSYPLSRPATLVISQFALSRPEVQSLLWYLASDTNYAALENAGFVGLNFGELPDVRTMLQSAFAEATAAQAEIDALEVTPEATAESTAEATSETTGSE